MLSKLIHLLSISILSFNFVESQNICNFTVNVCQELLKNGFHRNLTYHIEFENHSLNKKKPVYFYDGCILAIQQLLPAGIYVDPDELEDLRRNNKLSAFPHNGMNIEVAAPYANPFNVYIFSLVKRNKVETFLPVHARYQKPGNGGGKVQNIIDPPSTYLRCKDNRLEECDMPIKTGTYLCDKNPPTDGKCSWKQLRANKTNAAVVWKVPVGNLNHYYPVEIVTLLAVIIGSVAIMKAVHSHQMSFAARRAM